MLNANDTTKRKQQETKPRLLVRVGIEDTPLIIRTIIPNHDRVLASAEATLSVSITCAMPCQYRKRNHQFTRNTDCNMPSDTRLKHNVFTNMYKLRNKNGQWVYAARNHENGSKEVENNQNAMH